MGHIPNTACVDACNACANACDHCATACLGEDNVAMMARCIPNTAAARPAQTIAHLAMSAVEGLVVGTMDVPGNCGCTLRRCGRQPTVQSPCARR